MIAKIAASFLLLNVALFANEVQAQDETFDFSTGGGRREGMATLKVKPESANGRTLFSFTTKQSGVGHTNKVRLAVQWLSSTNREDFQTWQSAVFQLRVPQGGGSESPAIEQILAGAYYDRYVQNAQIWNNNQYVDLILVDRDQQVTVDTTNNYRGTNDGANIKVTDSRVVVGTDTQVDITFSAPFLDPVGVNQIWFKWIFYNDDVFCDTNRYENYCFATAPIDGQKDGYTYTTFIAWNDYYVKNEVMTFYWIIFAAGLFGVLGQGIMDLVNFALQIYLLIKAVFGWLQGSNHNYFDAYNGEIILMLILTQFFTWFSVQIMELNSNIPILGAVINLAVILLIDTFLTNQNGL